MSRWRRWVNVEQEEGRSLSVCAETVTVHTHWWSSVTSTGTHRDDAGRDAVCDSGADLRAVHTAALRVLSTCWDSSVSHCWMKLSSPLCLPVTWPSHSLSTHKLLLLLLLLLQPLWIIRTQLIVSTQTPSSSLTLTEIITPSWGEKKRDSRSHKSVFTETLSSAVSQSVCLCVQSWSLSPSSSHSFTEESSNWEGWRFTGETGSLLWF